MATMLDVIELYAQVSSEFRRRNPEVIEWGTKWNNRLGICMGRAVNRKGAKYRSGEKYIELSSKIVRLNINTPNFLDKLRETIIHEWCHALDWEKYQGWGHGATWKSLMVQNGLHPERCFDPHLWLVKPNNTSYAIRHDSGRVLRYLKYFPNSNDLELAKREAFCHKLDFTNCLNIVNLEHGWVRAI